MSLFESILLLHQRKETGEVGTDMFTAGSFIGDEARALQGLLLILEVGRIKRKDHRSAIWIILEILQQRPFVLSLSQAMMP